MGPSSIEVERYVGASLISNCAKSNHRGYAGVATSGFGGAPLIAYANNRPIYMKQHRYNQQQQQQPQPIDADYSLAVLAYHAQGAPLILARNHQKKRSQPPQRNLAGNRASTTPSDAVSVASDESGSSSNQELPRIIKPRKRRKKERKSPVVATVAAAEATPAPSPANACQCCDPSCQMWDMDGDLLSFFAKTAPHALDTFDSSLVSIASEFSNLAVRDDAASRRRLEVSTKIVTSPRGHRDLEIKFFSVVADNR